MISYNPSGRDYMPPVRYLVLTLQSVTMLDRSTAVLLTTTAPPVTCRHPAFSSPAGEGRRAEGAVVKCT